MTLAYAGCRLSEAVALTVDRVDLAAGVLVFATLKKRAPRIYRAVLSGTRIVGRLGAESGPSMAHATRYW